MGYSYKGTMGIERVLLVDDEPAIRKVAELSLRAVGKWEVILAASGAEAIRVASATKPDLILLDAVMPEMDGPATLASLRETEAGAEIPIIFLTGKSSEGDCERFLAMGARGVLPKPFDPMKLPGPIRRILGDG